MKRRGTFAIAVASLAGAVTYLPTQSGQAEEKSAAVYVKEIPSGYRDWKLISVAHEEGNLHFLRHPR